MREEIKELLKNAKTEEEAKKILEENNVKLTDEELDEVSGGSSFISELTKNWRN